MAGGRRNRRKKERRDSRSRRSQQPDLAHRNGLAAWTLLPNSKRCDVGFCLGGGEWRGKRSYIASARGLSINKRPGITCTSSQSTPGLALHNLIGQARTTFEEDGGMLREKIRREDEMISTRSCTRRTLMYSALPEHSRK